MDWKRKRHALMGVVGGVGVVAVIGGALGLYSWQLGVFLALAVWIIGATLINLMAS